MNIVNSFSFIKTVSNNCITVDNVVTNISLFCKSIPEFVASSLARSRSHKSIEIVKNRSSYIKAPIRMCRKSSVEHARWSTRLFPFLSTTLLRVFRNMRFVSLHVSTLLFNSKFFTHNLKNKSFLLFYSYFIHNLKNKSFLLFYSYFIHNLKSNPI